MPGGGGSQCIGEGGLPSLKEGTGRRREAPVSDAGRLAALQAGRAGEGAEAVAGEARTLTRQNPAP